MKRLLHFTALMVFLIGVLTPCMAQSKRHKSKNKEKTPIEQARKDTTINLISVKVDISCDSLRTIFANKDVFNALPGDLRYLYSMEMMNCATESYNEAEKEKNKKSGKNIVIAHSDADNPDRIYYDLIDLSDAQKAEQALYTILGVGAMVIPGDKLKVTIVTAAGRYSIDAFMKAAYKDDPLLILCPTMVPGNQLTRDVFNEIKRNKVYDVASKTWKDNKGTITLLLPGIGIPLQAGEKVGKEAERTADRVEKEIGRGADRAVKEVKRFIKKF